MRITESPRAASSLSTTSDRARPGCGRTAPDIWDHPLQRWRQKCFVRPFMWLGGIHFRTWLVGKVLLADLLANYSVRGRMEPYGATNPCPKVLDFPN